MTDTVLSTLKKVIVSAMAIFFINCGFVFAADSTGTPSGTAKQPDINQRGSNIIEVGNIETSSIDADSATVTGAMSAGTISTSSVSTPGTVSAGTVSAPAGAITNLNTNRTYVQRTPTSPVDATNKKYVDGEISSLQSQVTALGASSGCPSGFSFQNILYLSSGQRYTGWICVKNPSKFYSPGSSGKTYDGGIN